MIAQTTMREEIFVYTRRIRKWEDVVEISKLAA